METLANPLECSKQLNKSIGENNRVISKGRKHQNIGAQEDHQSQEPASGVDSCSREETTLIVTISDSAKPTIKTNQFNNTTVTSE